MAYNTLAPVALEAYDLHTLEVLHAGLLLGSCHALQPAQLPIVLLPRPLPIGQLRTKRHRSLLQKGAKQVASYHAV